MNSREIFYRHIRRAVKKATIDIKEYAQEHHNFISRTGELEDAIKEQFRGNGLIGIVYLDEKTVEYARFVHQGTEAHKIFPKNKRSLRWASGGEFIFAKRVNHPGTKADQFLYEAFRVNQEQINKTFEHYTDKAVEEITHALQRD